MPGAIITRNPRVIQVTVEEQKQHGAGRSAAEALETLVLEAVERRRIDRATVTRRPVKTERRPVVE